MTDEVKTAQLFRFRQFLAGVEDRSILDQMMKCVQSQLSILPVFKPYVEEVVKPKKKYDSSDESASPVTDGPKIGWVLIGNAPIVNGTAYYEYAKKLPKNAKIKYFSYGTEVEAKVILRGKVRATIVNKIDDNTYNKISKHIFYHKITHVWVD
jgi:hypothetical protein